MSDTESEKSEQTTLTHVELGDFVSLRAACLEVCSWQHREIVVVEDSDDESTGTIDLTELPADEPANQRRPLKWFVATANPGHLGLVRRKRHLQLWELAKQCSWMVVGCERGSGGTPHLQIAFALTKAMSFKKVKDMAGMHLETMKADDPGKARTYCLKENIKAFEYGTCPSQATNGKVGGEKEKARWDKAKADAIAGNWDGMDSHIFVQHWSSVEKINRKFGHQNLVDLEVPCATYLYGVPGSGKSRFARELAKAVEDRAPYFKSAREKWWDGYDGQKVVIIEDLDPVDFSRLILYYKLWLDVYIINGEVKGGYINLRPEQIIITSNYSLKDLCIGIADVDYQALRRRFAHINYFPYKYNGRREKINLDVRKDEDPQVGQNRASLVLPEPTHGRDEPRPQVYPGTRFVDATPTRELHRTTTTTPTPSPRPPQLEPPRKKKKEKKTVGFDDEDDWDKYKS